MKYILDVSNIVYGGYYGSPNRRISGFPVGGIRKLLGIINANIKNSDFIVCFDGGNTIKKELLPRYKAGRVPNYAVIAQLDLLREILLDCDVPFYWDTKYEADDFICSVVHFLSMVHDPEDVCVYSDDRDMACCVSSHVELRNVTSNGRTITKEHFEERVVPGEFVPFNTILLHKLVYGDKSDNYPGLSIPGLRFDELARTMCDQLQPYFDSGTFPESAFMDINIMEAIIDQLPSSFTEDMKKQIKDQAKIVFPQLIDVTANGIRAFFDDMSTSKEPIYTVEKRHIKAFSLFDINRKRFDFYCNMFGLNKCRPERYSSSMDSEAEEFKAKLKMRSKELASGAMAVERYQSRKVVHAEGPAIENMQLPI